MLSMNLRRVVLFSMLSFSMFWIFPAAKAATKPGTDLDSIIVVARLPLAGSPVQQMFFDESGVRHYLYIRQADQAGYMVVDITDSHRPKIITEHTLSRENLEMVGTTLGIAGRPESAPIHPSPAIEADPSGNPQTQRIRLLDLSDALHPRTLMAFDGVTSIVLDERRNMIYLTNGAGLWILHHRIDTMRQVCEEESKYSEIPMMCSGY